MARSLRAEARRRVASARAQHPDRGRRRPGPGRRERFLQHPHIHDAPARWCTELNVSERTLARLFQRGTGLSFSQWRQRACILHSLRPLAAGEPVTRVAARLGYDNPAAYTAAFGRLLGRPPTAYRRADPAG